MKCFKGMLIGLPIALILWALITYPVWGQEQQVPVPEHMLQEKVILDLRAENLNLKSQVLKDQQVKLEEAVREFYKDRDEFNERVKAYWIEEAEKAEIKESENKE